MGARIASLEALSDETDQLFARVMGRANAAPPALRIVKQDAHRD
jgi:hypothetical protein